MPNVVGQEHRVAKINLNQLGLELNLDNAKFEYNDAEYGTVIRTDPAAGATLHTGDTVTLIVSKGPEPKPVAVPSFLTLPLDTAQDLAETLGLKVSEVRHEYSDAAEGTVTKQSIAAATSVETGTEIVLTVSDGADPSVSAMEGTPPEAP